MVFERLATAVGEPVGRPRFPVDELLLDGDAVCLLEFALVAVETGGSPYLLVHNGVLVSDGVPDRWTAVK